MKRTRSHQVSFRLNDKEYALLQRKLAASGMSLTEFFIETIREKKIIIISDFLPLLGELKRQGVNLNQLTRRATLNFRKPSTDRIKSEEDCLWQDGKKRKGQAQRTANSGVSR